VEDLLATVLDTDEAIVIVVRHELEPAQQRLLARLGAGYIVDPVRGQQCARQCGHPECSVRPESPSSPPVVTRTRPIVRVASTFAATTRGPAWAPNWIDYRHSLVNVDRRALDEGEEFETCAYCGCELDVTPRPHAPTCPTVIAADAPGSAAAKIVAQREARRGEDGDEPDLDEPGEILAGDEDELEVGEEPTLEEAAVAPAAGPDAARAASSSEPGPADGTPVVDPGGEPPIAPALAGGASTNRSRWNAWTREDIIDAIHRWHAEHGKPPVANDWQRRIETYPTTTTVSKHFGSWASGIEAAGYPRPTRGGITARPVPKPEPWISVPTTGLRYRTPAEAYVAADEIEADGERVAESARFDGNEGKADQAIDAARELAEKIRTAAHIFENGSGGGAGPAPARDQGEAVAHEPAAVGAGTARSDDRARAARAGRDAHSPSRPDNTGHTGHDVRPRARLSADATPGEAAGQRPERGRPRDRTRPAVARGTARDRRRSPRTQGGRLVNSRDAYLLGIFDGEGCITPCRNGSGRTYIHVIVNMSSEEVVRLLERRFGGTVRSRPGLTAGGLTMWDWRVTGANAQPLLSLLARHSITKRHQARLALKMLELTRAGGGRGNYIVTPGVAAERESIAAEIRSLNGGRNRFKAAA
jgi:hypothetical protein